MRGTLNDLGHSASICTAEGIVIALQAAHKSQKSKRQGPLQAYATMLMHAMTSQLCKVHM